MLAPMAPICLAAVMTPIST